MPEIELFSWNPDYPLPTRLGPHIPWRRPINNFGDLLGPVIVRAMLSEFARNVLGHRNPPHPHLAGRPYGRRYRAGARRGGATQG
jgi:hypothetical protein